MNESYTITGNQSVEVSFPAKNIFVQNATGAWVYVRIGTSQIPDANFNDLAIAPFTQISQPCGAAKFFGFGLGTKFLPTASAQGGAVTVTFDSETRVPSATTISAPGATFATLWAFAEPVMGSLGLYTLVTCPSGRKIHLFAIHAWADPTHGAQAYAFFHTVAPDIAWGLVNGASAGYAPHDHTEFLPQGIQLPTGQSLIVENDSGTIVQPAFGALYQII